MPLQSSDQKSHSQRAFWQALDPLLHLLTQINASALKPEALSRVLLTAAADVETVPSHALVALLHCLRLPCLSQQACKPMCTVSFLTPRLP